MGPNERRQKIIELLCLRRRETMGNLAHEFGVSRRTILLDIEVLSCAYPIITMRGKYGGGIKIMDGYRLDRKYLSLNQIYLLRKLAKTLSGDDRDVMESILRDFALKNDSRL